MRNNFRIYAALSRKEFEFGEKKVSSSKDDTGADLQKCRDDDWMVQICDNQSLKSTHSKTIEEQKNEEMSHEFEECVHYEDIAVSNTKWNTVKFIVLAAFVHPSIYVSTIVTPISVGFLWHNTFVNRLLVMCEIIYVLFFCSNIYAMPLRSLSWRQRMAIIISVAMVSLSIYSLTSVNGENAVGLVRIFRFHHCASHLKHVHMLATQKISAPLSRALMVALVIVYLTHLLASIFYYVVRSQIEFQENSQPTWVTSINGNYNLGEAEWYKVYIYSLYFTTQTIFTVGYGDCVPVTLREKNIASVFTLVGAIVFALIIATVSSTIKNANISSASARQKREKIIKYMLMNQLKDSSIEYVLSNYDGYASVFGGKFQQRVLKDMPMYIRLEIALHEGRILKRLLLFQSAEKDLLLKVSKCIVPALYIGGETILSSLSLQTRLRIEIIRNGEVNVCMTNSTLANGSINGTLPHLCTLRRDDAIGEYETVIQLIKDGMLETTQALGKSEIDIGECIYKAKSKCDTICLDYIDLKSILKEHEAEIRAKSTTADAGKVSTKRRQKRRSIVVDDETISTIANVRKKSLVAQKSKKLKFDAASFLALEGGRNGSSEHRHSSRLSKTGLISFKRVCVSSFQLLSILLLMASFWHVFFIPLNISRRYKCNAGGYKRQAYMYVIDYVSDICQWCEIFWVYHKYSTSKTANTKRRDILRLYCLCRALLNFPFEAIAFYYPSVYDIMRVNRFGNCIIIFVGIDRLKVYLRSIGKQVGSDIILNLRLLLFTFLFVHVFSTIAMAALLGDTCLSYEMALYWTLTTLTTTGFGDVVPQTTVGVALTILIIFCSVLLYAGMIASITSLFHGSTVNNCDPHYRLEICRRYFADIELSKKASNRFVSYLQYYSGKYGNIVESSVFKEELSKKVVEQIKLDMREQFFKPGTAFYKYSANAKKMLLLHFSNHVYMANDVINSSAFKGAYFIRTGAFKVNTSAYRDRKQTKSLMINRGESFGLISLFTHNIIESYEVTAETTSEIYFLSKRNFDKVRDFFVQKNDETFNESYQYAFSVAEKQHDRLLRKSYYAEVKAVDACQSHMCANNSIDNKIKEDAIRSTGELILAVGHSARVRSFPFGISEKTILVLWNFILLIILHWNFTIIPIRVAFMYFAETPWLIYLLDYTGDLFLLLDICLRSRKSFLNRQHDDSVTNTSNKYTGKRYILDLCASVPLEAFVGLLIPLTFGFAPAIALCRSNRLLRFHRIQEHASLIKAYFTSNVLAVHQVQHNIITVVHLIIVMLFAAHLISCTWFFLANRNANINWALKDDQFLYVNQTTPKLKRPLQISVSLHWYLRSFYFTMATLTTVGFGDISPQNVAERSFTVCLYIIGTVIFTFIIGSLEKIVAQLDVTSTLYQRNLDMLKAYCRLRKFPPRLHTMCLSYYEYLWKKRKGVKARTVLECFPENLRSDIVQEQVGSLLSKIAMFKSFAAETLQLLATNLEQEIVMKNIYLFECGELAHQLYLLFHGEVKLLSQSGDVVYTTISNSSPIEEGDFLLNLRRCCSAKASKNSIVLYITRTKFDQCVKNVTGYNEIRETMYSQYKSKKKGGFKMSLVRSLISNMKSSKMMKMQAVQSTKINGREDGIWGVDSRERLTWECFMFCVVIYDCMSIFSNIAFDVTGVSVLPYLLIGLFVDCVYMIDIYLRGFKFARKKKNGIIIDKRNEIRQDYMQSTRFKLQLLALLPINYIAYMSSIRSSRILFSCRVTRLFRLSYLTDLLQNIFVMVKWFGIHVNESRKHLIKMFGIVILAAHFSACVFICISSLYPQKKQQRSWMTWNHIQGNTLSSTSPNVQYSVSLYWSFYTLTTVGYGDIYPKTTIETVWAIFIMMLAALLCDAGITAILAHLIDTLDRKSAMINQNIQQVRKYFAIRALPEKVSLHLKKCYASTQYDECNINESLILKSLPLSLKHEILVTTMWETFSTSNPLYNENAIHEAHIKYDHGYLLTIIKNMVPKMFFAGQTMIKYEAEWQGLYFLVSGHIKIMTPDNMSDSGETIIQSSSLDVYEKILLGNPGKMSRCTCFIGMLTNTYYICKETFRRIQNEILLIKLK